jgi:hypothetical protein
MITYTLKATIMKSKIIAYLIILITCLSFTALPGSTKAAPQQGGYYDEGGQQYQDEEGFYEALSPYGEWTNHNSYGEVWIPNVGRDFRPYYTNGHWVNSEYGWTWVSNYPWGWAPFHYGRWTYDDYYGWIWIPGDEWGPAWVSWRSSPDYYGWAPLGPGMSIGVNVSFGIPASHWAFLPCRYINDPYMSRYYAPMSRNTYIYNQTNIINNVYVHNNNRFYRGPDVREVERVTNSRVSTVRVARSSQPGATRVSRNQLTTYQPRRESIRRELADNNVRSNNNRVIRGNDRNNNGAPNTPERRTIRRTTPDNNRNDNNNRVLPAPNSNNGRPERPSRIDRNDNNNRVTPPARTPDNNRPERPGRIERNNDDNRVTPAPQPNRPVPERMNNRPERPSRFEREAPRPESRPAPQPRTEPRPQPQQRFERPERPQAQPRPQPQPRMQSPRPSPQPRFERPSSPPPSRPAPAPQQRNNNGGGNDGGGGRVRRG